MKRIMPIFGTRPEAIKVAPVVRQLNSSTDLTAVVTVTGQHREMLDQVNAVFGIVPAYDLNILRAGHSLTDVSVRTLQGLDGVLRREKPDAVLVQGDTTSAFAAALAAYYQSIPVIHLEAGLRSGNPYLPFPEEANRRLIAPLAELHLAPTARSRDNLLKEGIAPSSVVVTGNTVIDALDGVLGQGVAFDHPDLAELHASGRRILLATTHRRENLGAKMFEIARALSEIADEFPELAIVVPMHLNPEVRSALLPALGRCANVYLIEPLVYAEMIRLISISTLVLTDSGGIQEEAPAFGKPVLVLRDSTERPEAIEAGTACLVGTRSEVITDMAVRLLTDPVAYGLMANAVNPYGDGLAAQRSAAAIRHMFGLGDRMADFDPASRTSRAAGAGVAQ